MADHKIILRIEKYQVTGMAAGYHVSCGTTPVYSRAVGGNSGRMAGTGTYDPRTNAQRGVVWLKNQKMVREQSIAEEVKA